MPAATGTRALRRSLTGINGTSVVWTDTIGSRIAARTIGASTIAAETFGTRTIAAGPIGARTIGLGAVAAGPDGDPMPLPGTPWSVRPSAAPDGGPVPLPGTPWSVRPAAGPAGRPAVEIYAAACIVDVMVAPALAPRVLRGARSLAWAGQPWAVAWGFLPARPGLSVWFTRGLARRRVGPAQVSVIAGWFWIAPGRGAGSAG